MRIDILTLFPELFDSLNSFSIIEKAIKSDKVKIVSHNLRDYAENPRHVDDSPYGGGAGMIIKIEPIDNCISKLKKENNYDEIIYLTPDGEILNQKESNYLSTKKNLILLCGHYKGVDHRVRDHLITKEISIGNYVLSGGELPAAILCDSIIRLIPGIIGDESSALSDSFQDNVVSAPIYTRPANYKGLKVPDVLISGNQKEIEKWKDQESIERTKLLRPKLFDNL
jgi:tRNA (guanine37-N1)-methyltransferase